MDNQASYEAMQQAWGQQEPSGLMGLLNSPMGQALLGAGLGALSSSGSTAQAIGRGGLLGLSAFSQAQDKQENRLLQMAQAKMREEALASLSPSEGGGYTGDISKLLRFMTPDQVQSTFSLGRNKLRQMQEVTNADGSKGIYAIDDYGDTRDTGLKQAPEITKQDLGGRVVGMNAYTGQQVWGADKTQPRPQSLPQPQAQPQPQPQPQPQFQQRGLSFPQLRPTASSGWNIQKVN
ncbi:hypothetical protein [Comamonas terrigena]|uniref:hypothetical protein n=1 Tax=Comamonas terrigena TaxID=32013 RepID=UPI0028B0048D|nr:hypothetical protein [Comamonas terrigena]